MGRGCQLPIWPAHLKGIPGPAHIPAIQGAVEGENHRAGKGSHFVRKAAEPLGRLPAAPLLGAPQIGGLARRHRRGRKLAPGLTVPLWRGVDFQRCRRSTRTISPGFRDILLGEKDSREGQGIILTPGMRNTRSEVHLRKSSLPSLSAHAWLGGMLGPHTTFFIELL